MFNLDNFIVKQEIADCKNPVKMNWNIAIDIGYSSVKGMAPNKRFCFLSYVRKIDGGLNSTEDDDIYYKDEDGIYLVGNRAQDLVRSSDTNDTKSFYDRDRYFTKEFQILARTAVAIGLMNNKERKILPHGKIYLQTGLPAAYLKEDARLIKSGFLTPGTYYVKIGSGPWYKYEDPLKSAEISVMAQPAGTLYSIMVDDSGQYHEDKKKLLSQNILIADIGFGTFDPYGLVRRKLELYESINDLGMRKVLETASDMIYNDHRVDLRIPQMRRSINDGFFRVVDIKNMTTKKVPVAPYIEKACEETAGIAVKKLYEMAHNFRDYDTLVVTGGTGAAWFPYIKEKFAGIDALEILPGNDGCDIPIHYANVRGYYMSAFLKERNGL